MANFPFLPFYKPMMEVRANMRVSEVVNIDNLLINNIVIPHFSQNPKIGHLDQKFSKTALFLSQNKQKAPIFAQNRYGQCHG